ncbi:MAG: tRNA (guanosine(46)-N7)-methyltransferase TrmB, partial [Candidatus Nanopelagicales bacterium]
TRVGGFWHLATDWTEYAEQINEVVGGCPRWTGGIIEHPELRPVTRYERRGMAAGRESTDLLFERIDG